MESKLSLKKKIAELERNIQIKDTVIAEYQKQSYKQKMCSSSGFCSACKHGIPIETCNLVYDGMGGINRSIAKTYLCELDKDCASFERK